MVSAGLFSLSFPLPFSLAACHVDLCASRQLLLTSSEAEGRFHGLSGHPVLPQPGPPALGLQPELLMGKPGGGPYFWECRSGGVPGFPVHGPVAGQYSPEGGLGHGASMAHCLDEHSTSLSGHWANGLS